MPNIEDFEWPYNGSDAGEQAYDEGENLMRKVEELDDKLHQERERAERNKEAADAWMNTAKGQKQERDMYREILRKLVEAQDEIDVEAERPLHQRSTAPMVKKIEAIKEARRALCPHCGGNDFDDVLLDELLSDLRDERRRAENAERDYEAFRNAAKYWSETALRLQRERDKWKEAHEQRIRHLKSENNEVDRLRRERDHFANLLCLSARFAEETPDTQVEADNGEIVDGSWLAAKIRDELEERE